MLFLQMLFPDKSPQALRALAVLGILQASGQAVRRLHSKSGSRWPSSLLQRASSPRLPIRPSLSSRKPFICCVYYIIYHLSFILFLLYTSRSLATIINLALA